MSTRFARRARWVAVATGVALAVAGVGAAPAGAQPGSPPAPAPTEAARQLTESEALTQAKHDGRPVRVDVATTPTDIVTANPDGSVTLQRKLAPVRKRVAGTWRDLDATLRRDADGTVRPAVSTYDLALSGGGTGPLATMSALGRRLSLTAPFALPAPELAGDTATYRDVLAGVDLQVRATAQGGFSEVFIVRTPAGAANPALRSLALSTSSFDVALSVNGSGDIVGHDRGHRTVLTAAAPRMWDSGRRDIAESDTARGLYAIDSTARAAGTYARSAPLHAKATSNRLTLEADTALLADPAATFPIYLDPVFDWSSEVLGVGGWATVSKGTSDSNSYANSNYWLKTPDPDGHLQVGNAGYNGTNGIWSHSLINFALPLDKLTGAEIDSATLDITEVHSYSCYPREVDVYAPATTLTSTNATWNKWETYSLGAVVASANVAYGYTGCLPAGVPFDVKSAVVADVNAGKNVQTFFFKAVNEASDLLGYKEFDRTSATLTVKYNRTPQKPAGLSTNPATACPGTSQKPLGKGPVTLYAPVFDPDGGSLGVAYKLWKTADLTETPVASTDPNTLTYGSGTTAVLNVTETTLTNAAAGTVTNFSWKVQITDGRATSPWSDVCTFDYDSTKTGAPNLPSTIGPATIGQEIQIRVDPPASGSTPSGYMYQLNALAPVTISATNGVGDIHLKPTRRSNTLTVTSLSAGGNIGDAAVTTFSADPGPVMADQDMTGDNVADLLTVGAQDGLPAGVWQGTGRNNGQVIDGGTNIGIYGSTVNTVGSPADFTGTRPISGHFEGSGLQDVFFYNPATGGGVILAGSGDGSALTAYTDNEDRIKVNDGALADRDEDFVPIPGTNAIQVVNVGDTVGNGDPYPDLLAVTGDAVNGYHLAYFTSVGWGAFGLPMILSTQTPTGGDDWNNWTLSAAQLAGGTSVILRNTSGQTFLWRDLGWDSGLTYTPYALTVTGWDSNATVIQAADIDSDGDADMWSVGPGGSVKSFLLGTLNDITQTGTMTAGPAQSLTASTHVWGLADMPDGVTAGSPITGASDLAGGITMAGTATWNKGDLFSPDAAFNGHQSLTPSTSPINTTTDFTVSAWVNATAAGGVVFSRDGWYKASATIKAEASDNSWQFMMADGDSLTNTFTVATAGPNSIQYGVWTQLTATYNATTGLMTLYINGVSAATAVRTSSFNGVNGFRLGAALTCQSRLCHPSTYFTGQMANVQTWNAVVPPSTQTPAGYYQPITQARFMDTRYGTGGTTGPVAPGGTAKLKVTGLNGVPAANVSAVMATIASVNATGPGNITVYPDLTVQPITSNLNYVAGQVLASSIITPVGYDGYIDLYVGSASTDIVVDIAGYFTRDASAPGNTTYTPVNPVRIIDDRNGTGGISGAIPAGGTVTPLVTGGPANIPAGVKAIVVNVTGVSAANGFFITYPNGTTRPAVSGTQYHPGGAWAAMAIIPVGADGRIAIYSSQAADVIVDLMGYFTTATTGQKYHPATPTRLLDTRTGAGTPMGPTTNRQIVSDVSVTGPSPSQVLSVAVTQPTANGQIISYPTGGSIPLVSLNNFTAGQVLANGLISRTNTAGSTELRNNSSGTTHLVVDYFGYFA